VGIYDCTSEGTSVHSNNQFTPYTRLERHGWYVVARGTPTSNINRTRVRRVRVSDSSCFFFFSFFFFMIKKSNKKTQTIQEESNDVVGLTGRTCQPVRSLVDSGQFTSCSLSLFFFFLFFFSWINYLDVHSR